MIKKSTQNPDRPKEPSRAYYSGYYFGKAVKFGFFILVVLIVIAFVFMRS